MLDMYYTRINVKCQVKLSTDYTDLRGFLSLLENWRIRELANWVPDSRVGEQQKVYKYMRIYLWSALRTMVLGKRGGVDGLMLD